MKKYPVFLFGFVILLSLLITSFLIDTTINFPDANLETAIREKLGLSSRPIYKSQLINIQELDLSNRAITDLDGIQYFRNLKELNLADNQISDLSPLASISTLRELNLENNEIGDLEKSNFDLLLSIPFRSLNLNNNFSINSDGSQIYISDIAILESFTELEELFLIGADVKDHTPIANLTQLRTLELQENEITDISFLSNLHKLTKLNLRGNYIKDLSPISNHFDLTYLNLHSNKDIQSIEPISHLANLEKLILRDVPVGEEAHYLSNLQSLQYLNVRSCGIRELSFLVKLMESGALQDDKSEDVQAYLDIRDNAIPQNPQEYAVIAPYWDNIHTKYPILIMDYTLEAPVFSHASGFYEAPFWLTINGLSSEIYIHYTLDGSLPTRESPLYTGPIQIRSRVGEPNTISMIDTISFQFKEPSGEVFKITTIQARAFDKQYQAVSPVVTRSYMVDEQIHTRYSLPIVSLVIDPSYLFDTEQGIYVTGRESRFDASIGEDYSFWPANYHQQGGKWSRPGYLEYFYESGSLAFTQTIDVRIHGAGSRSFSQKSLRIYAKDEYSAQSQFMFDFFKEAQCVNNEDVPTFETLVLRNTGSDWPSAFMRDILIQKLIAHTSLDTQAFHPVIVFLNGEYWGLYNIRERYDQTYFKNNYGIDPDDLVILEDSGQIDIGIIEDVRDFDELLFTTNSLDLSQDNNYANVKRLIDVTNFIDYQIIELFSANRDWPTNNIKYWRIRRDDYDINTPYGQDGLWRWLLFDTDDGFIYFDDNGLLRRKDGDDRSVLLESLLVNDDFKVNFINRFADHLNTSFNTERVIEEIDAIVAVIEPEMPEQIERWHSSGGSMESWLENVEQLRNFARKRPAFMIGYILEYFNLSGTYQLSLQSNPDQGYVRVNSIDIISDTPGIKDPSGWTGTYFQGIPLTVTAIPKQGFVFSHWEGAKPEEKLSVSITIDGDVNVSLMPVFLPAD